jgi:hypothetical protein
MTWGAFMGCRTCPHCGGYMEYVECDDDLCCDTCYYAIRGILRGEYREDTSDMGDAE